MYLRTRRFAVAVLSLLAVLAVPSAASAAGGQGARALTIHARPNPTVAGDPMVIFGRLKAPNNANQTVVLWHRINPNPGFTRVQQVQTDANGFYIIERADGVVTTNRNWFVVANGRRSKIVHEKVQAIVSATASTTSAITNHPVTFTGKVYPAHAGEQVTLQRQVGDDGEDWHRVSGSATTVGPDGSYSITKRWRVADTYTVRVHFRADRRNAAANSDSIDIAVQQNQHPGFTLTPSADPITVGDSVNLTGTLAGPDNAQKTVTLFAHGFHGRYAAVGTTTTAADGSYSFTQAPAHKTVYQVRTDGGRKTAQVFVTVHDIVTAGVDNATPVSGQPITFSGTVTPDKSGHRIELQRKGVDGDWHTVQVTRVGSGSTYLITHQVEAPGTKVFRVHINGGPVNWGASSDPITVTVSAPPPTA